MPEVRIAAEPRTEFGKGPARRTRRQGRVPAIIYGHGTDTRHITLPGHELMMALKTSNVLIRIDGLPGGNQLVLPKAVQRDPIRGSVEHVDLIMVRRGEKVTVDVQVQVTGEVFPGGLLDQQLIQVAVEAEATNIPGALEVNIEGMEIGAAVHAGELTLPAGVTLVTEPEALVLHVLAAPTAEQLEAELGEVPAAEEAEEVPPVARGGRRGACRARGQAQESAEPVRLRFAAGPAGLPRREGRTGMSGERWLIVGLGNPGPRLRRQPAQRRVHGGGRACRPDGRPVPGGQVPGGGGGGAAGWAAGHPRQAPDLMNLSGGPVAGLCRYYRIPPGRLLVMHDELDIPFGTIRLKLGGGDNGHNGLRSVTASLGTREYYRLRFGIGRPPGRMDPAVFVLRDFSAAERKELPFLLDRAADAAEALLGEGLAAAQNAFHGAIPGVDGDSGLPSAR